MIQYTRNFEDVIIGRVLADVPQGFYLDVGACHPWIDSNTFALYTRGWQGVCMEPHPGLEAVWQQTRPRDRYVQAAAGEAGTRVLHMVPGIQGSTLRPDLATQYRGEGYALREFTVQTLPLNAVLQALQPPDIHLLSVDVEGCELEVLQSIDLQRWRPWLIVAEATVPGTPEPSHHAWAPLLEAAGYGFEYFDGVNRFYLAQERAYLAPRLRLPPNVWDRFRRSAWQETSTNADLPHVLVEAAQYQQAHHRLAQAHALLQSALQAAPTHPAAQQLMTQVRAAMGQA